MGGSGCTHCGNPKHTRDTCFKLHDYPEWWNKLKAYKQKENSGGTTRVAIACVEPQPSFAPLVEAKGKPTGHFNNPGNSCCYNSSASLVSNEHEKEDWIVPVQ